MKLNDDELVQLPDGVVKSGQKIGILFEGREAAQTVWSSNCRESWSG